MGGFWQITLGTVLSGVVVLVVTWANCIGPFVRGRKMRRPFTAWFGGNVPGEKPLIKTVPANTEVSVQIRMEPRLHYRQEEVIVGFYGDAARKPLPQSSFNDFIKVGARRAQTPGTKNPGHSIDDKDRYHIAEPRERTRGNTYPLGFMVQTRAPGEYPLDFMVVTDSGEGRPLEPLTLVVVEPKSE